MTYDADKTGLFDFALETAGGTIASTRCTETYDTTNAVYSVWGFPIWWTRNTPRTILQPGADFSAIKMCWTIL
jgi:SUN domain-containing protein 1/2